MSQSEKRLEVMRSNPRKGWTIEDVKVACSGHGVELKAPKGGSHYKVTHTSQNDILTIPHGRPIKTVYIRKLVAFIDAVKKQEQ